jgi:alkaline phosphatase D
LVSASCQKWSAGLYTAYRYAVQDNPDLVVFCGDYIYEDAGGVDNGPRDHPLEAATDLDSYRRRYALYRSDPLLQAAHAACPWVVTWDDHEVFANYAGDIPAGAAQDDFRARRWAAYRAWWEHMPVRFPPPRQGVAPLYREFRWGRLATIMALDSRQHRTDQGCGDGQADLCADLEDPSRTMLGAEQEEWLAERFGAAAADGVEWVVLVNQTIMTDMTIRVGTRAQANMDQWDGYPLARRRLLEAATGADVTNLVVLTGDFHASIVGDVTLDGAPVAGEFVAPAISSGFDPNRRVAIKAAPLALPDLVFGDGDRRGYILHEVTRSRWDANYRWVERVDTPDAPMVRAPRFYLTSGEPAVQLA